MKNRMNYVLFSLEICFVFYSCDFPAGGGGGYNGGSDTTNTRDCSWHEGDINAVFYNPLFLLPGCNSNCEDVFQNNNFEWVLNRRSIYEIMENVENNSYLGTNFDFTWTASIASNKICSPLIDQTHSVTLDLYNYNTRFAFNNIDMLYQTPNIPPGNNISSTDYIHKMVFQIYNVENTYDNHIGSLIWECTWYNFVDHNHGEWLFNFPYEGIKGIFIPDRYYQPVRKIYINGNYEII